MLALALASFRGLLIVLAASLTVSPTSILPEQPPRKKKGKKYTQSRHLFLFNDLVAQQWELGPTSPEVPLEEGHTPPSHNNSPVAMGVPLELGPWLKRRQKAWPIKCSGKAQLWAGVWSSNAVQDRTAQRRMKTTSLKSSFVWPNLRTTLLIV